VRRGHHVTLFAAADSTTSAHLVPIVDRALWHRDPPSNDFAAHRTAIFHAIRSRLDHFDIVHSHLDYLGFDLATSATIPTVSTLHGRLDVPELHRIYRAFSELPFVSISNAQRRPLAIANWLATVYHGIDLDAFTYRPRPSGYLAFLGRISPEKGLDTAIRVARRAGVPIMIAARPPLPFGQNREVQRDREYYEAAIQPLLSEPDVELIGEVGGAQKDDFLGNAAGLLFPIRWPEPFGLVMPEALACGTPVLALRQGSVPEVIQNGATGFICDTEDELVRAVNQLTWLDRRRCRLEVERRFSPAAMAEGYEQVYAAMASSALACRTPAYA
jgi:glycosyltransferase involved in cell wall biosynthesis